MHKNDTIAAIATGHVTSGISIIRISGPGAIEAVDKIFVDKKFKHILKEAKTHTIHYGFILNFSDIDNTLSCETASENLINKDYDKSITDEVLVSVMKGPKSYTGEDVVEINCHGGTFVTNKVLEICLMAGARLAEPGEFTKRAFLNGRIDLSEAEAVMDLISASSKVSLVNSQKQLSGFLKNRIVNLRKRILHETAFIESALDDPEHFDLDGYPLRLSEILDGVLSEINALISSSEEGEIIKSGIRAVILGKPNVGKSTFLNTLLGRDKAIVTDIAGTTRDTLDEALSIGGIPFVITDTAGIRETENVVERIGVEKAKEAAAGADLILYLVDKTCGPDDEDVEILKSLKDKKVIILLNKSDIDDGSDDRENVSYIINRLYDSYDENDHTNIMSISAKNNTGIDEFKSIVKDMFFKGKNDINDEVYITSLRHKEALVNAGDSLVNVRSSIESGVSEDFYTIDLMDAYTYLGHIIGEEVSDDLVNEIFSKFCMGK